MKIDQHLEALYRRSDADVRGRGVDADGATLIYGDYTSFVQAVAPTPADLLDVGCGNGWSAYVFSRLGYRTTGADLNAAFFEPPFGPNLSLKEASVLDLPFADASFDIVCANQMLEHVPDPQRGLTEMMRVLRPGGVLCVVGPNLISPLTPLRTLLRYAWRNRPAKRIFVRDAGMPRHPDGNTVPEAGIGLLRNIGRVIVQSISSRTHFEMRQPDLAPPFMADNDACYLCNPLDLVHFFRERGCAVLRNGKPGRPPWISAVAAGTWIAVRKGAAPAR